MAHKVLNFVFCCLVLLLITSCAEKTLLQHYENIPHGKEDIIGWEDVRWGMSVEDINKLYPLKGDFKADEGLFESNLMKVDGHFYKSYIIASPYYWEKLPTVVSFYFDKNDKTGKLLRVKLMVMTQFGKVDLNQTPLLNLYQYIIRKYGWPYQFHPVKGVDTTIYYWSSQSGMIQSRFTKNKMNDGTWNYISTTNYLSKEHPFYGRRYDRR